MMQKVYQLTSQLPAQAIMQRLEDLFAKEGVQFRRGHLSITSTNTTIAILGIQPTLYSRRNWVGLNPFTFVSGVDVCCKLGDGDVVKIDIHINQLRTFIWVVFWAMCSLLAAFVMSEPEGAILFIAVTVAAWFVLVGFLGGLLIKKEICDCLNCP